MQLNEQQLKKVKRIAAFTDNHDIEVAKSLIDLEEKLDSVQSTVESIASIEMPEPKDYTDQIDRLESKIDEPLEVSVTLNII